MSRLSLVANPSFPNDLLIDSKKWWLPEKSLAFIDAKPEVKQEYIDSDLQYTPDHFFKDVLKEKKNTKEEKEVFKYIPVKSKPKPTVKITAENYNAVAKDGSFGIIYTGKGVYDEHTAVVHTDRDKDKQPMLSLKAGDEIPVKYLSNRKQGFVTVQYVTRAKYFSPGQPVTSVTVGLDKWEG